MKEIVAVVTALIVALTLIIGLTCCQNQNSISNKGSYNNDICPICETSFHFVNITWVDYFGYKYIYACDNEHIIICSEEQHTY